MPVSKNRGAESASVTAFADIYQNMIDLSWESGTGVGLAAHVAGFEERYPYLVVKVQKNNSCTASVE